MAGSARIPPLMWTSALSLSQTPELCACEAQVGGIKMGSREGAGGGQVTAWLLDWPLLSGCGLRKDLWLLRREDKPGRWREKGTKWGRKRKQRSMGIWNEMNVGKNSVLNICLGSARVLPWHGWRGKVEVLMTRSKVLPGWRGRWGWEGNWEDHGWERERRGEWIRGGRWRQGKQYGKERA